MGRPGQPPLPLSPPQFCLFSLSWIAVGPSGQVPAGGGAGGLGVGGVCLGLAAPRLFPRARERCECQKILQSCSPAASGAPRTAASSMGCKWEASRGNELHMLLGAPGRLQPGCLLSGGPKAPIPAFLPHEIHYSPGGSPRICLLISWFSGVHLVEVRAAQQPPKGGSDFLGGSGRPHRGSAPSTSWRIRHRSRRRAERTTQAARAALRARTLPSKSREQSPAR